MRTALGLEGELISGALTLKSKSTCKKDFLLVLEYAPNQQA